MATAAVERPTTAEERVLALNNPPPRPQKAPDISHRQRAAINTRGAGVARSLMNGPVAADIPDSPPPAAPSKKIVHASPSDFLAGPKEPGHVKRGVRRYEDRNESTVGKALTEEWILGRKEDDPVPQHVVRQRGPKDNLEGLCCSVRTEEAKPRLQRAPGLAPPHTTAAPYSETELPPRPAEALPVKGKRRFHEQTSVNLFGRATISTRQAEADRKAERLLHSRRNKANESLDVLNLGQYTREDLNEVERKIVLGPRQFIPASLPPRQRPIIARLKSHANETHDIFGTGKGVEDVEPVHRKNPGASAPKNSCAANIFGGPPLEQKPPRPFRPSQLLTYEEAPNLSKKRKDLVEAPARPASANAAAGGSGKKLEAGQLFNSKSPDIEPRGGRCRGVYAPKTGTNNIF
ncbi:putative flagellum targeting protein kharon1 [Trypanosoma cruzi]|uniref:Flagellum targeting protein kharon1 n=3 Tax=Trypanosoma cruzi TaxID=5693 RepID=Q4D3F7_TRYCC|nr:hypothetical protein, conserved [Trypanosoma cruzi]EAN87063.1 hypothetical protein, conserved [Trypanosoma cruzi]KAF5226383.1 hypothetical protein ECC02_000507 [Trypanosoma cruzi]PWV14862.1 putative flagellum targeting protein kharon1 [Trypanosoma cruzi]RNC60736.1 hypothetical protein TcCL_ESM01560 [Trypanosoma cruzi]|eukprot:XP_808914.1 hypothetical protein [Trypanosoma cruzi strain CL Brener]